MNERVLEYLNGYRDEIFSDLMMLVNKEACTSEIQGLREVRECLKTIIEKRTGLAVTEHVAEQGHNVLSFSYGNQKESIVFAGHYDTVHPAGSFPVKTEGNKLYGPGVYDMKSGLVAGIWCVKACQDLGLPVDKKLVFVFNGDEETGSAESKEIIAQYAKDASAAVILEPSTDRGNLKTGRKGILHLYVTIHGKAAHAGNNHAEGVNAIEEMAREIVAIQSLTDYEAGTTVNVGVCNGGSKVNVVPDLASFEVDCRFKTKAERQRVWDAVTNLPVFDCRTTRKVSGGAGKMPMEETEENLKLFETAKECAAMVGLDVDHEFVGGGSDGNEISAMGVPTIDGMGAYGANAHSREEYIDTTQYIQRIAMVTLFAEKL